MVEGLVVATWTVPGEDVDSAKGGSGGVGGLEGGGEGIGQAGRVDEAGDSGDGGGWPRGWRSCGWMAGQVVEVAVDGVESG